MADGADDFIESIDPGLLTYKHELYMRSVTSISTLKYLRPREVKEMKIPEVYKRLLIDKIVNLQSPETKKILKEESSPFVNTKVNTEITDCAGTGDHLQPKQLKFVSEVTLEESVEPELKSDKSDGYLENEVKRLNEERDTLTILLVHKKDEYKTMIAMPVPPKPLAIPGVNVSKFLCDNCHHRGHKSHGNKGNRSCPFLPCQGYHFCGLMNKHKEFKQEVSEMEKEISNLEKEIKSITDQIDNLKTFLAHNATNFIVAMKPRLRAAFPTKYNGRPGTQLLQKDLRFLKIALGGKILPDHDLTKDKLAKLINEGKSKINSACGTIDETDVKNEFVTSAAAIHNNLIQGSGQSIPATPFLVNSPYSQGNSNMQAPVWSPFWFGASSFPQTPGYYGCPYVPVHSSPSCTVTSEEDGLPPLPNDLLPCQPPPPPPEDV